MKRKLWIGLAALLTLTGCRYENFDKRCEREAREFTAKQCPRRMDPYTIMDSLTYTPRLKQLTYFYTLEGDLDNKALMTSDLMDEFQTSLYKNLSESIEMKAYKEHNLNFRYVYISGSTGEILTEVTLTPDVYNR
ncbi:MAG: hypothetical protein NC388_04645 [Clostridium sp.]|nr:hypothetical protein [Clostridium sp.]